MVDGTRVQANNSIIIPKNRQRADMKTKPYNWLLLDADGTLFDYDQCERQAFFKTLRQMGLPYEERFLDAYRRINAALWLDREQGKIEVGRLKIQRFQQLFEAVNIEGDPTAYSGRYLVNLAGEAELLEFAEEALETLSRFYNLVLVTNGLKEVQRHRLKKSGLDRFFSEVIISDEIGASKPDTKFFEITFAKIGNPAKSEVLIIGDSLTSDIQGGNNFGIDACWLNPSGFPRPPGLEIKYEMDGLPALVDLLAAN